MATVDIIITVLLVIGAVRGFISGLILQVTSLAALILGIWMAIRFSNFTATVLMEKFGLNGHFVSLLSFAITFLLVLTAIHFLGRLIDKFFNLTPLGIINKLFGLVFGVAKYGLIISVIIVFAEKANHRFKFYTEEEHNKTILYKPLSRLAPAIYPYLHFESFRETYRSK